MKAWMRAGLHGLTGLLALALTLALVAAGAVLWASAEGSLAFALRLAPYFLPAGQTLESSGVSGSLREGGRIARLRWQQDGQSVEVQDLQLGWDWQAQRLGDLRLHTLQAQRLQVQDHSPPQRAKPWSELVLPVRVDLPFAVEELLWEGAVTLSARGVQGHYQFDGEHHRLRDARVHIADGRYALDAELQARRPMALALRAQGQVLTPVTVQKTLLSLQAQASVQGTLFGPDAQLDLAMDLQPQGSASSRPLGAMQGTLQARIRPGQDQPIEQARAQWRALDLADLWPQAPQTQLTGQAQVVPDGAGWAASIQLQNRISGPLDRQRLPVQSADAQVLYRQGQWLLTKLQASVAGGSVKAQGAWSGQPARWNVQAGLQNLEPAQLDARWQGPALTGTIAARQAANGVAFDAELRAPQGNAKGQAAPINHLQAKGLWRAPAVQLEALLLEGPGAQVQGQLQIDTASFASQGKLRGSLPGATLSLEGDASAASGKGEARWQVSDMAVLQRWLRGLPVLGGQVPKGVWRGAADATVQWRGGWRDLGSGLQLQGRVSSNRLASDSTTLSEVQLELSGTLRALALQLRGKAAQGRQTLAVQLQSHGGWVKAGQWHALLDHLQLDLSDGVQPTPWRMALQQAVALDSVQGPQGRSLNLAEGELRLSGPAAGVAGIRWQPVLWSQPSGGRGTAGAGARWRSQGQLQGLPLAWLELLGRTQLDNLALHGDLVLGGQWDASHNGKDLRLQAGLRRSGGDLLLLGQEGGGSTLPAGLRDARVDVLVQNDAVQARLLWDSQAAGNAQADFNTRLQTVDGSTVWASDAPVQGRLQANLPRVGAWSLVAPVGWRMQGTLAADATLSGTRARPNWKGTLEARELALRSVVNGIDFSNGVMRLQLNDQHMDIAEFTLQGAGGASGGSLVLSGAVDWLPPAPGAPLAARLRMVLEAKAQGFRVLARPDQRLVVSGKLNAQLTEARLSVRGALVADQALIVLPEDNAPQLGSDVVVSGRKARSGQPASASARAARTASPSPGLAKSVSMDLQVSLDPGPNFQIQGHGLATRLAGQLTLRAQGSERLPTLVGELRAVNGTYRAYGQRLRIEEGTLRFAGALDNPALDILALRPNLPSSQTVGVQVSGTAQLPIVRLYAEPDLPEADKLTWLVLGRSSANGGTETALLQQAALALLASKGATPNDGLFKSFGLDEVSLGQAEATGLDGSTATETTVKFGKRLSNDFYVAYERSLAGTLGTLYVFYDLSRRFTLRAQSGTQNAVDLIFTARYD